MIYKNEIMARMKRAGIRVRTHHVMMGMNYADVALLPEDIPAAKREFRLINIAVGFDYNSGRQTMRIDRREVNNG